MGKGLENRYGEREFFYVEMVQPKGPTFLPPWLRLFLGDSVKVGGPFSKERAEEKMKEMRGTAGGNPNNKHIFRIRSLFD